MSNKQTAIAQRSKKGTFLPGASGNPLGNAARARRALNSDTIREMHAAFREGGREAIDKVMKQSPAIFLKLLVLLVPRELEVTHTGGVKAMTDEQLEAGIEAIQAMLRAREEGVVDVTPDSPEIPVTSETSGEIPETSSTRPTRRKAVRSVSPVLPEITDSEDSVEGSKG